GWRPATGCATPAIDAAQPLAACRSGPEGLPVDHPDRRLRIARAGSDPDWRDSVQSIQILARQLDIERPDVLLQPIDAPRAGDRHDVLALCEDPGERQLRRRTALLARHRLHGIHEL